MHIFESSPRMSKTIQAIGRVARYRSHQDLPLEERNVKIWRYWSVASPEPVTLTSKFYSPEGLEEEVTMTITDKTTIDESLYALGMKTIKGIESFFNFLKEMSVTSYVEERPSHPSLVLTDG